MSDHLERGAVTVQGLIKGELQRVRACTGRAMEWGGKSWKRMKVVPPVSSLSPTLRIYIYQLLGKTKVSECQSII